MTSLDRLKALMAATALLAVLAACNAGADTAQADVEETAAQNAATAPVLHFEDLPEDERNARLALGAEVMQLTAPGNFPELVRENISQGLLLTIPMNHPGVTEEQKAEAEAMIPKYYERYEDHVAGRISGIYAGLYTVEELEELIAFFSSGTGMKFKAAAAEVDAGITQVLLDTIGSLETDIVRIVLLESYGMEPRQRDESAEETVIDPNPVTEAPDKAPDGAADPEK